MYIVHVHMCMCMCMCMCMYQYVARICCIVRLCEASEPEVCHRLHLTEVTRAAVDDT